MSGLVLAALGCVLAALAVVLWLYGADLAYVVGLVPTVHPYRSAPASGTVAASDETSHGQAVPTPVNVQAPAGDRVVIPRIGVDVVVAGGNPTRALTRGAYHQSGTPDPGKGGNVVLAGHRNLGVFSLLYRLRPGDPVLLYWKGAEHAYRVSKVFDVGADDAQILEQAGGERLTLYTCRPREFGDKRTVVVAVPVQP